MRKSAVALILGLVLLVVSSGCREESKIDVASKLNPSKMATMTSRNVATFISDSGVVQYKIVTPLWRVYEEKDTPYWDFPEGLYLQKYDPYFSVIATVAADSAKFFKNQKLWRLDGHVEMTKAPKDLFQTAQLFWDQRDRKIYSDSFIHIETETHVLEGLGFESDEKLSSYRIIKPQGIFPVNRADFGPGGAGMAGAPAGGPAPMPAPAPAPAPMPAPAPGSTP